MAFQSVPSQHSTSTRAIFRQDWISEKNFISRNAKGRGKIGGTFEKASRGRNYGRQGRNDFIALNMVFTTPASVIEQVSTKVLLDDLVDESVRQSARNPVMMQFDPSSGWVRE